MGNAEGAAAILARFVRWILSPVQFLILRLAGDVISAAIFLLTRDLLYGAWFVAVSLATLSSEILARKERKESVGALRRHEP